MIVCRRCCLPIRFDNGFWSTLDPEPRWVHVIDGEAYGRLRGHHRAEPFDTTEEQEQAMTEKAITPAMAKRISTSQGILDTASRQHATESSPSHELLLSEYGCNRLALMLERNGFEIAPIRETALKESELKAEPVEGLTFHGREIRSEVSLTEGILSGADVQTVMHGNLDDATVFVRSHGDTEERPITALALVWRRDDER